MSKATCEERATLQDSPTRSRPPGCAAFSPLRCCSPVTDRVGYAPSSRFGQTKNRQQRGMTEYFNRLLSACSRGVVFAATVRLDTHRVRHQTGDDLDNHHRGSGTDHDARAPFRMRKIRNEIVCLTKTRVIRAMHLDLE